MKMKGTGKMTGRKWQAAFFTAAVILWMGVIFWFSAQPADISSDMSESVGMRIGQILIRGFDSWSPEKQLAYAEGIDHVVRKCAHAVEYAILAGLLVGMFYSYGMKGNRIFIAALAVTAAYAGTDEFHQIFVEGRACMLTDVLIDSCGGAAMCIFCRFCLFLREHRYRKC